jgi:hypothetical protein
MNRALGIFRALIVFSALVCFEGAACAQLQTWNGSFYSTYTDQNYPFAMVGTDPSQTNQTTTITAYILPISVTIPLTNGNVTFDPQSIVQKVLASPVLCNPNPNDIPPCTIDFATYGTDLGTTQYVDAFQRGNFWSDVQTNTAYHVVISPVLLQEQYVTVTSGSPFVLTSTISPGEQLGAVNRNWILGYIQQTVQSLYNSGQIHPGGLVIPVTHDVCIYISTICQAWGHHDVVQIFGQQQLTYAWSSYGDVNPEGFSGSLVGHDVDVLSHEVAEWVDDPFVNNLAPCGGNLEVGDPLVQGQPEDEMYDVNGFTYHLQNLVWLPYFGESPTTSVGGNLSFFPSNLSVCSNGG